MAPVLVTGATGLLGAVLVPALSRAGFAVVRHGATRSADVNADLRSTATAREALDRVKPGTIINLVALTDVDHCEERPREAFSVNVRTAEHLASWIGANPGTRMIQVSTDQVYDGAGPHREADVSPLNIYAYSKYCAEQAAARAGATILRVNFFGQLRQARPTFSEWISAGLERGERVPLVHDVLFSPLHADTLCRAIVRVTEGGMSGTFNLGSRSGMSKCDFGLLAARTLGLDAGLIRPVALAELGLRARRPRDMRMDVSAFESAYAMTMPDLKQEISLLEKHNARQA